MGQEGKQIPPNFATRERMVAEEAFFFFICIALYYSDALPDGRVNDARIQKYTT